MMQHNKTYGLVFDVIKEYASAEEPINQADILEILRKNAENKTCNRRTVGRALETLRTQYGPDEDGEWPDEHIHLHYSVTGRSTSAIIKEYYFTFHYEPDEDAFTDEELMFLMDAVQFSKHIDESYAQEITGKLAKLSKNSANSIFQMHTIINEKHVPVRKDFFVVQGDINEAISENKMVSFFVNKYGIDKKLHHVTDKPVEVCPFRIVVSDGYHYLLCSEKDSSVIKSYRLDRLTDVQILDEVFVHTQARKKAAIHPNDYLVEHRYMNTGETVSVTLDIDSEILGDVIDSFGTSIKIDPAAETATRLTVHLKSSERDIIDWAMRYGEYAVITYPEYLRNAVMSRANHTVSYYREDDEDLRYFEVINKAEHFHSLSLFNIDLNGRDAHKNLKGIQRVNLRHNGIKDFGFLSSYKELRELTISNNSLENPDGIACLDKLAVLNLSTTGITDLDFLTGLKSLVRLRIFEFSLENIEAIYSLPRLRALTVNKPVARLINKSRLKKVFGPEFRFTVDDHNEFFYFRSPMLPQKQVMELTLKREAEYAKSLASFEITNSEVKNRLCSLIDPGKRYGFNRDKSFCMLGEACDDKERLDLYKNLSRYAGEEFFWYVTCDNSQEDAGTDLDPNKVFVISIFKRDHGRKLVAMAENRNPDSEVNGYWARYAHIRYLMNNNIGWAEVSENLERSFARACTLKDVVAPAVLVGQKVIRNLEIEADDYHYFRMNDSGKKMVKKICYGHIETE